jgi:predicted RNA-binding Zn ribbon-like protein
MAGQMTYQPPGGREPAPGNLAIVQDFANSHFIEAPEADRDRPAEPIGSWAASFGLLPRTRRLTRAEVARIVDLRRLLRAAMFANHGEQPMSQTDVRKLNSLAQRAALHAVFDTDGDVSLTAEGAGVGGMTSRLFAIVAEAQREGTWRRLKICRGDDCEWAFYDRSKNGSGSWCSMKECGNRAKARSFRQRHRL